MLQAISHCRTKFAVLVALAALMLVPGLTMMGGGRALAQDAIDCDNPANAELPECLDPGSKFTSFTVTNPSTTLTINPWTASAICTNPLGTSNPNSCANNNSKVISGKEFTSSGW